MNRTVSLTLALVLCVVFAGPSMATTTPSPSPVVAPTSPWSLLFNFITSMLGLVRSNNKTSQQAKTTNNQSTVKQMDQAQIALQAWPNLMQDSRALREDAIALAQLIAFARKDPNLADKNWVAVTKGISTVKTDFKAIHEKQAYTGLLQFYSDYQSVADRARRMWNAVDVDLGQSSNSPTDRMNVLQAIYSDTTKADILLDAAFLPEYWATSEAAYLVTQYKTVTGDAKTTTGTAQSKGSSGTPPDASSPDAARLYLRREPSLQLVAWRGAYGTEVVPEQPVPANARASQSDAKQERTDQKVGSYGKAPDWMTATVNLTRSEYKIDWRNTLLSGLFGAAAGFVILMFLPTVTRSFASPHGIEQLNVLTRSLAFRADVADQLARELGALHLDVLSYVLRDESPAPPVADVEIQRIQRPRIEDHAFSRIKTLRSKLRDRTI